MSTHYLLSILQSFKWSQEHLLCMQKAQRMLKWVRNCMKGQGGPRPMAQSKTDLEAVFANMLP